MRHIPCKDCRAAGWHIKSVQKYSNGAVAETRLLCMKCYGLGYTRRAEEPADADSDWYRGDHDEVRARVIGETEIEEEYAPGEDVAFEGFEIPED